MKHRRVLHCRRSLRARRYACSALAMAGRGRAHAHIEVEESDDMSEEVRAATVVRAGRDGRP